MARVAAAVVVAIAIGAGYIPGEVPPISVWDGVYTASQGERGEPLYREHCEACHGTGLDGGIDAPPLAGSSFLAAWDTVALSKLFLRISRDMADNYSGKLEPSMNTAILSYILRFNGFPSGNTELPAAQDILSQIRFEASKPAGK